MTAPTPAVEWDTTTQDIYEDEYVELVAASEVWWWIPADEQVWSEQTAADLDAAGAYLLGHGWCQGGFFGPEGTVCMMGAVMRLHLGDDRQACVTRALHRHLVAAGRIVYYSDDTPARWNDRPTTTLDDVFALLRDTAAEARRRAEVRRGD